MNKLNPHIGKNVIETLTLGMYENPKFIFREYVQNAADQIDLAVEQSILNLKKDGLIKINIDSINRCITIEDNATGINQDKVSKFLGDVANSEKDVNKRKGFRGIGRLGGLGYCDRLIFETSSKGESLKTKLTLNAKLLRDIIGNIQDTRDASSVINAITQISQIEEKQNKHYFKVILENVSSDELLDADGVRNYLSMVAPVPFSTEFCFGDTIVTHFKTRNIFFDEYLVKVNETQIFKAYKDNLIFTKGDKKNGEIKTISYFDVKDENSLLLAVGWYGISTKVNYVIDEVNIERGIRIRKNNIAIGNESNLYKRFKNDRTNLRYIGEIHVISNGFIPNARRDYFNLNKTVEQFEKSLESTFENFESKLPHVASNLHNRLKTVQDCRAKLKIFNLDIKNFHTSVEQQQRLEEVSKAISSANRAALKIDKIYQDSNKNYPIRELFDSIVKDYKYHIVDEELVGIYEEYIYPPLKFRKVEPKQEEILNEIVIFLQNELGHQFAAPLIKKLERKYN